MQAAAKVDAGNTVEWVGAIWLRGKLAKLRNVRGIWTVCLAPVPHGAINFFKRMNLAKKYFKFKNELELFKTSM